MNDLEINIINPLTQPLLEIKRESVRREFFDNTLSLKKCPLSLYRYISCRPEKFYCNQTFLSQFNFLNSSNNANLIMKFMKGNGHQLDQAFKSLGEVNKKSWHDSTSPSDEYDFIKFVEDEINPTFLKLTEGVFGSFIYLNAYINRIKRQKSIDGLNIYNQVEELVKTEFKFLSDIYCNTTRNSIAHGSVKYSHQHIEFKDKNNTIKNTPREYIHRFHALLDTCNGLALAYKKFFFINSLNIVMPNHILLEELYSQTEAPWWEVEACLSSEAIGNRSQLMIFVTPSTRDYEKVKASSIWTAILAESFAPNYDRYFLSLRSPIAYSGFAAFNGKLLSEKRSHRVDNFNEYAGILENNLIFWVPFVRLPKLFHKVHTFFLSFKLFHRVRSLKLIQTKGIKESVRIAKVHRNGWRVVLSGSIILESKEKVTSSYIKTRGNKLIHMVLKEARKKEPLYSILRFLPLGYARISLIEGDYRRDVLENFGLRKELIGTIQVQSIRKVKAPDIFGATIEQVGKVRHAWNKAWLSEGKN